MNFLHEKILDNSILNILIVAGVIILVVFSKRMLSHYAASLSYRLISRAWKKIDSKQFSVMFLKPLSWFLIVTVSIIALSRLNYPRAWQFNIYKLSFDVIPEKIAATIFIYSFFRLAFSVIDFISTILSQRAKETIDKSDDQLVVFFRDFIKVFLGIVAILLILKVAFNQNIGNLLTGLSIVGAALALSARESLENLIASFIIFFDKPFYVGDTLKVNAVTGTVERIGLRSTRIRTGDKTLVTVPNKQMVDSVVDNWSMRTQRRAEIKLEFSEKTTAATLDHFLAKTREMLTGRQVSVLNFSVFITEYSKNGSTVTVEYFTPPFSMEEFNKLRQEINLSLMRLIAEEKIEMASGNSINIFAPEMEAPRSSPII